MGRYLPTTYLKWREPKNVRHAREKITIRSASHTRRLIYILITSGALILPWCAAKLNPVKNHPWPLSIAMPVALASGVFFVYGMPWLRRLCPSLIRVTDRGILAVIGNRGQIWKYKDIQKCSLASNEIGDETVSVLAITSSRGKTTLLGIDESVAIDELTQILSRHDVSVD